MGGSFAEMSCTGADGPLDTLARHCPPAKKRPAVQRHRVVRPGLLALFMQTKGGCRAKGEFSGGDDVSVSYPFDANCTCIDCMQ